MRKIKRKSIVPVLLVLFITMIFPASSQAYGILKTNDNSAYISGLHENSITFQSWNGFSQETRWAIDYASRQWNNRTGHTKLYHSATQHNAGNIISVEEGKNLITKAILTGSDYEDTLMLTSYYYGWYETKWQIYEADIVVDSTWRWYNNGSANGFDVQNVMTHEFGHMLGLDEEYTQKEATMYEKSSPGETKKRDLHQDDLNGFFAIYG